MRPKRSQIELDMLAREDQKLLNRILTVIKPMTRRGLAIELGISSVTLYSFMNSKRVLSFKNRLKIEAYCAKLEKDLVNL